MPYLLEWTYKGRKHFDLARDKRWASRMRKNIPFVFPGATGIKVSPAKEPTYAEQRRLERLIGIKE